MSPIFPEPITSLPEADVPLEGVKAWLSQADTHQIIFMEFEQDVEVPAHAHGAQLGIVLEGRIDLTMAGEEQSYTRGDRYYIPAGVEHSARIHAGYADVTYFDEPDRWPRR